MPNISDRLVEGFRQRVKLRLDVLANELKQEMLASFAPQIDEAVSQALANELETLVAVHLSAAGDQLVIQLDRTPPAPVPPTPPVDTPPVEAPPTPVEVPVEPSIPVSEPAPTPATPPIGPDLPTPPEHPTPGGRP